MHFAPGARTAVGPPAVRQLPVGQVVVGCGMRRYERGGESPELGLGRTDPIGRMVQGPTRLFHCLTPQSKSNAGLNYRDRARR